MKTNIYFMMPRAMKHKLNDIEFGTKQSKNKAKKFVCKLITDGFHENKDLSKLIKIPSSYFRKAYNGRYLEDFLNPLIDSGIVQRNDSYSNDENNKLCKSYRIVQDWLYTTDSLEGDNFICEKDGESDKIISVNPDTSITKINNYYTISSLSIPYMLHHFQKAALKADFDSLYFNIEKLKKAAEQELSYIDLVLNDEIDVTYIKGFDRIKNQDFNDKKSTILTRVKKDGYNLIQDGDEFYIDDLDRYIDNKKDNMRFFNETTISKLKKGIFNIGRNKTNNRLDSNFTVMSKSLLKVIMEDNNLVEIDLCNSQFAILADWLKKEGLADKYQDVSTFCNNAGKGTLYYSISTTLPYMLHRFQETEETVKKKMLQMAFSRAGGERPEFKESCYRYMPNVIEFIDGYKKKHKYKNFSIALQKKESFIFIDNLLYNIKANGFFCITKHDSLIVRKSNMDEILQILRSYFNFVNFDCTVKVKDGENKFYYSMTNPATIPELNPEDSMDKNTDSIRLTNYSNNKYNNTMKKDITLNLTPVTESEIVREILNRVKEKTARQEKASAVRKRNTAIRTGKALQMLKDKFGIGHDMPIGEQTLGTLNEMNEDNVENEHGGVLDTQIQDETEIAIEDQAEAQLTAEQEEYESEFEANYFTDQEDKPDWWQSLDYFIENYGSDCAKEMYEGQIGFIGKM